MSWWRNFQRGFIRTVDRVEHSSVGHALDKVSAFVKDPVDFIKDPKKTTRKLRHTRERISHGDRGLALKTASEMAVNTAVAVALVANPAGVGRLVRKVGFSTPGRTATTLLTGGALAVSPSLQDTVQKTPGAIIDAGMQIGDTWEGIAKPKGPKTPSNTTEVLKKIGGAGLTTALVVGGGKLLYDKYKDNKSKVPGVNPKPNPISVKPVTPSGSNLNPNSALAPVSTNSSPVIAKTEDKTKKEEKTKPISVTVNNNIKINNKSSANKRFINKVTM